MYHKKTLVSDGQHILQFLTFICLASSFFTFSSSFSSFFTAASHFLTFATINRIFNKITSTGFILINCIIYIQIACLISFVCFITVNGFWWLISLFTLLSKKKTVLDLLWVPIVSLDLSNSIWFCNLNFWFSNSSLFLALSCCDLNSLSSNCLKEEKTQYM